MSTIRFCLLLCFTLTHIAILSQKRGELLLKEKKADSLLAAWNDKTPGISVAVIKEGQIVYHKSKGLANLEYDITVSDTTPFHAASLSKQFTAFCILILQEKGLLSLDDDIRKYIPELPIYPKTITLRHLATHTSGLREQWRLLEMGGWRLDDVITKTQILSLVYRQQSLNFMPGEKFMYCNTGFTLLAEVVERVTGISFSKFTQDNIFTKLGMDHSFFYDDFEKLVKQRAYSYYKSGTQYKKSVLNYSIVGPTSLFTTAVDLSKWASFLNAPDDPFKKVVELLNQRAKLNDSSISEAALGQFTGFTLHGLEWFDHSGSDAGFRSHLARFPEYNASVAVLSNATPLSASTLAISLADIFLSDLYRYNPKSSQKPIFTHNSSKFISLSKEQLAIFCGKYWHPDEWYDREIKLVNDTLVYIRPGGLTSRLVPVSANEFKMLADKEDVSVFFENSSANDARLKMVINKQRTIEFVKYQQTTPEIFTGSFFSDQLASLFSFSAREGKLYAFHTRLGEFELTPINSSLLTSNNRNFKKIKMIRNRQKKVIAIEVSNDGVSGMLFKVQ